MALAEVRELLSRVSMSKLGFIPGPTPTPTLSTFAAFDAGAIDAGAVKAGVSRPGNLV